MSLVVLLPYPPLLHLIENVIARLLEQTLLQLRAHEPFVIAECLNLGLIDRFLVVGASFTRDLLHLGLHVWEHLEDLTQLVLGDHEDVAFTVHNSCAVSTQILVVGEHHFHFTEVSSLCIHIERDDDLRSSWVS